MTTMSDYPVLNPRFEEGGVLWTVLVLSLMVIQQFY